MDRDRTRVVILSSMDPLADPRCSWIAKTVRSAGFVPSAHGFTDKDEVTDAGFEDGTPVTYCRAGSPEVPSDDFVSLLRDQEIITDRDLRKLDSLARALAKVEAAQAEGRVCPSAEGLAGYSWLINSHAIPRARQVLAHFRGTDDPPEIVIATDSISLLAALGLKAEYSCRIVYDAQSFGPDNMLVSPRPRAIFHYLERAALKSVQALSVSSGELKARFQRKYGAFSMVGVTPGHVTPHRFTILLGSGNAGAASRDSDDGTPRLAILCGHEPTVDPRVVWTAQTAVGKLYDTWIFGWTDGYGDPKTEDPAGAVVLRYGSRDETISERELWALLIKHRIIPRWFVLLKRIRQARRAIMALLGSPWMAICWLAQKARIARFTTDRINSWASIALEHLWRRPIKSRLPFKGWDGYYWYLLDYAVRQAGHVLHEIRASGWAPTVVHANDPDTLVTGALLKAEYGARLVYDAHEFGPDAYLMHPRPRWLFRSYERHMFNHVDGAVTVSTPIASEFNRHYGHIVGFHAVPNAAPIERPEKHIELPDIAEAAQGRMRFMFQGGIAPHRGIDQLIEEWKQVDDSKAVLFIRGPENAHRKGLIEQARATGRLDKSIFFLPSIGEGDLIASARHADVGLITYRSHVENHKGASPNKLSQYMQAGAAILSVNLPSIEPILDAAQCGEVYDDTTDGALADKINRFAAAPDLVRQYGEAGKSYAAAMYSFSVFASTLLDLYEGKNPAPNKTLEIFNSFTELKRIQPRSSNVELGKTLAENLDTLPEAASDFMALQTPVPAPPYEKEVVEYNNGKRSRRFIIPPLPSIEETKLETSLVESLAPVQDGQKSVLFLNQSYYHFYHLARALRERGFHALLVSFESPDSANAPFYHGEDLNLWHPDPAVRKARAYDLMEAVTQHFDMLHFHGAEVATMFEQNYQPRARDAIPWDFLELKRRGVKIGHSISGCNTGQRPSRVHKASGGVCDKCIWQLHPEICSDPLIGAQNTMLESLLDLNALEIDWPADTSRHTKASYYDPLTYCVDTEIWSPDLAVPDAMKFERETGEILVFHAVGNFDKRAKNSRNIKGTGAVIDAIERLQAEGYPVRLVFKTGVPSKDMRFYQVQADIVVDQLNYGRYGASARECMALGLPVISRFIPEQPDDVPASNALAECPLIHADETTVYDALKDLLDHPQKREAAGQASREYAIKWHSKESCAARFETVYDRLMKDEPVWRQDDQ